MKIVQLTTIGQLAPGQLFVLTPGGPVFQKIPGRSPEGNCLAIVPGDDPERDAQSLSPDFSVYELLEKPPYYDNRKTA